MGYKRSPRISFALGGLFMRPRLRYLPFPKLHGRSIHILRSNSVVGTDVASADPAALLQSVNENNALPSPSPERGAPLFKPDSYVIDAIGAIMYPVSLYTSHA